MLVENQFIKATGMHSRSESIAVVVSDQIEGKPVRVMSVVNFKEYDVDVSQITEVASPGATKDTPMNQIQWTPFSK